MNIAPIEWKISASFDDGSHMVTFPAINKGILLLKKPEMADIESLIGLAVAARDAQWQAALAEQEPVAGSAAWDNSEGWESLAWELCADENGEESCNELIWEGGPVPEPWGERWLKYEDEAKRLIKLVHKHVPAPSNPAAQERAEPVAPAVREREAFEAEFPIPEGMVYWDGDKYGVLPAYENSYRADRYCGQWLAWQARAALSATPPAPAQPIDMLLYCPNCGKQHVDKPEGQFYPGFTAEESWELNKAHLLWDNPPHRSHMCHGCGCVWRPADVPTNGVETIKTEGKADTWPVPHNEEVIAALAQPSPEPSKPEQAEAPTGDAAAWWYQWVDDGVLHSAVTESRAEAFGEGGFNQRALTWVATLPPASAAGERLTDEQIEEAAPAKHDNAHWFKQGAQWARAALATKPQAGQEATPPAQTVQDGEQMPPQYMLAKLQMVMPLFQEARDALTAITEAQRKLHGISSTLADRMDDAGTFSLDDWSAARTRGDEVGK